MPETDVSALTLWAPDVAVSMPETDVSALTLWAPDIFPVRASAFGRPKADMCVDAALTRVRAHGGHCNAVAAGGTEGASHQ